MKTKFTKEYLLNNKGCYDIEQVEKIPYKNNQITLHKLFKHLPIKDFTWFLVKSCDLTLKEKQLFALHCAKQVLHIYENQYPNDKRVRECIEATELFIDGKISTDKLTNKRAAADAAAADAAAAVYDAYDAAAADADAATTAVYDAYDAAAAADASCATTAATNAYAYAAADAAADADDATADAFKNSIWKFIKTL